MLIFISLIALYLHLDNKPYVSSFVNQLQSVMLFVTTFTLEAGLLMLYKGSISDEASSAFGGLLLFCNVVVVVMPLFLFALIGLKILPKRWLLWLAARMDWHIDLAVDTMPGKSHTQNDAEFDKHAQSTSFDKRLGGGLASTDSLKLSDAGLTQALQQQKKSTFATEVEMQQFSSLK